MNSRCNNPTLLGKKIREERKIKGLSGEKLADKAGISQSQVSKFENGLFKMKGRNLNTILTILDIPNLDAELADSTDFLQEVNACINKSEHNRAAIRAVVSALNSAHSTASPASRS